MEDNHSTFAGDAVKFSDSAIEQFQKVADYVDAMPLTRRQKEKVAGILSEAMATVHRDALLQGMRLAADVYEREGK